MTFKSHIESKGTQCPKCGSTAIKASGSPEAQDKETITVAMFCAQCGARWRNYYTLSKAEDP